MKFKELRKITCGSEKIEIFIGQSGKIAYKGKMKNAGEYDEFTVNGMFPLLDYDGKTHIYYVKTVINLEENK